MPEVSAYHPIPGLETSKSPPNLLAAAIAYASAGYPVFPLHEVDGDHRCSCGRPRCENAGKHPRTPHGFKDATTDTAQVLRWWRRWTNANIGIPTGAASGLLVIDVDDFAALEALEGRIGKLPATLTASTGSGGMHLYYRYPVGSGIGSSTGKHNSLGIGLDVRGEGGYVVAPPSRTMRPYEVLDRPPQAHAPVALVAALTEAHSARRVKKGGPERINPGAAKLAVIGPPIGAGARNDALTKICGRLHDGSRDLDALVAALDGVNRARCTPPLELDEIAGIAASIHKRPPCKPGASGATPETLELVAAYDAAVEDHDWRGMRGRTDRDVLVALVAKAREIGKEIPGGVRVGVSYRDLAPMAATSKRTLVKAVRRLREAGWITKDDGERRSVDAGAFVLLRGRAKLHHSSTGGASKTLKDKCGEGLRAPRLRWSAPEIKRLGKTRGAVIDALDRFGPMRLDELAERTGHKRPRDLRRRVLPDLEAAAVVECSGETVALAGDWREALDRERERAGEIAADERDRARYEREREAFAQRRNERSDEQAAAPPAYGGADGEIGELVRLSPLALAIREYLDANPHDADQPASWIGATLWAFDLVEGKPDAYEVEAAIDVLGGADWRRSLLAGARRAS